MNEKIGVRFRSTFDIIKAVEEGRLAEKMREYSGFRELIMHLLSYPLASGMSDNGLTTG